MPDQIEAAAWISSGVAYNYEEASHPPLLAISTWGDSGHDDMRAVVASDNANGGYSLFMTGPPSWPEKGYSCFHHGGHDLDYALICEFFGNIAALRRQNGFVSVPVSEWPEEIEFAGRLVKAPGAGFKVKWEEYPHAEIPDLVERGLTPDASPDGCGAGRENGGKTPAHRMDGVILSIILSVSGFFVIISLN